MAKGYSIQEEYTEWGPRYILVDPQGNQIYDVKASKDDYGGIHGYYVDNSGGGGEGDGFTSHTPIDLDAINARAAKGNIPFGAGMGPALGYTYGMKNSSGNLYRKFDAQGNLTEYLDENEQWQPASDLKPTGLIFNASTGNLENTYGGEKFPNSNLNESNASSINRYAPRKGGWLGEGGWKNLGMLALTALSAGVAGAASGAGLASGAAGTAAGANALENASRIAMLLQGGSGAASGLGTAFEIGNQLLNIGTKAYGAIKDHNPEAAYIIEQLQAETKKNEDAGMSHDKAVEAAMGVISQTNPPPEMLTGPATGAGIGAGSDAGTGSGTVAGTGIGAGTTGGGFSDITKYLNEQEEDRKEKEEGEEAVNLLSQMATGQVKTPPPAEIDYFYDIGGESVFATPKQESLMPSPFEDAPEAVEGAMPRYQYQDPKGGYLYADGGMVDEYTIDDLYRMLGSK